MVIASTGLLAYWQLGHGLEDEAAVRQMCMDWKTRQRCGKSARDRQTSKRYSATLLLARRANTEKNSTCERIVAELRAKAAP